MIFVVGLSLDHSSPLLGQGVCDKSPFASTGLGDWAVSAAAMIRGNVLKVDEM